MTKGSFLLIKGSCKTPVSTQAHPSSTRAGFCRVKFSGAQKTTAVQAPCKCQLPSNTSFLFWNKALQERKSSSSNEVRESLTSRKDATAQATGMCRSSVKKDVQKSLFSFEPARRKAGSWVEAAASPGCSSVASVLRHYTTATGTCSSSAHLASPAQRAALSTTLRVLNTKWDLSCKPSKIVQVVEQKVCNI